MYRDLIRRAYRQRIGTRRRLLNDRESNVLHYLLDRTIPPSPFTNEPEPSVLFNDLYRSSFFRANYGDVTRRTVLRELNRLSELGFLRFRTEGEQMLVELDFDAITRHPSVGE